MQCLPYVCLGLFETNLKSISVSVCLYPTISFKSSFLLLNATIHVHLTHLPHFSFPLSVAKLKILRETDTVLLIGVFCRMTVNMRETSGTAINFWAYVLIFSEESWTAIFVTIFAVCIIYVSAKWADINTFLGTTNEGFGFVTALGSVCTVCLQREIKDITYHDPSSRIAYLTITLCSTMVFAFYSGVLTSLMTVTPAGNSITSLADVLEKDLQMIVLEYSSLHSVLVNSKPDSALHKIYYDTMVGNQDSFYQSLTDIADKLRADKKTVNFGTQSEMLLEEEIISLPLEEALTDTFANAFPKDSEFLGILTHYIRGIDESGLMDKIKKKWLPKKKYSSNNVVTAWPLDYFSLIFPCMVLSGGMVAGVTLGFCETLTSCLGRRMP